MKTLVLSLVAVSFALVSPAHASYFVTECSTADGQVQYTTGQMGDELVIQRLKRIGKSGSLTLRPWEQGLEVNETSSKMISTVKSSSCDSQPEGIKKGEVYGGISTAQEVTQKTIEFSRKNGKAFPKWFPSLSNDGKTMKLEMRCEYYYDNMELCEAK